MGVVKRWVKAVISLLFPGVRAQFDRVKQMEQACAGLSARLGALEEDMTMVVAGGEAPEAHLLERGERLRESAERGERAFEKVFVLGGGPSMLELSPETKAEISKNGAIAMNRYTVFWEKVGIWPDYVFLADSLGVGRRVFLETLRVVMSKQAPVPCMLLEQQFARISPDWVPAIYFRRDDRKGTSLTWAKSLEEPLHFHRGSLTSLLNLITVANLANEVVLVGVDLNRGGNFFDDERSVHPHLFNPWDEVAARMGRHATAVEVNGWKGSVLDHWESISTNYAKHGVGLSCLNKDSLLVEQGLLPMAKMSLD